MAHRRGERLCLELNGDSLVGSKKIFEYFATMTRRHFSFFKFLSIMHHSTLGQWFNVNHNIKAYVHTHTHTYRDVPQESVWKTRGAIVRLE